jgi:predicted TIM-barrel fold metal-dependent hydrolase
MPIPPDTPERGNPVDIPKAARDWPNLNFIIYHSALRPLYMFDTLQDILNRKLRNGVPDIQWTTQFAQLAQDLPNVYAEIGTTFASTVITFPTAAAHVLGQLMKYLGPHRIVFGTDSVYYGSPQWQIEAFWRFEIPESIRRQYGYPPLTKDDKRRILGLNSARLYRLPSASERSPHGVYRPVPADYATLIPDELKTVLEFPGFAADNLSKMKARYLATGSTPSLARFGWIRT